MTQKISFKPSEKMLRQFSLAGVIVMGLVAGPLMLMRGHERGALGLWVCAGVVGVLGLVRASWLRWPYVALAIVTWPIGWVVSTVLLALIYFVIVTPIGLVFRLMGRDAMNRRFEPGATSYWQDREPSRTVASYLKQF